MSFNKHAQSCSEWWRLPMKALRLVCQRLTASSSSAPSRAHKVFAVLGIADGILHIMHLP